MTFLQKINLYYILFSTWLKFFFLLIRSDKKFLFLPEGGTKKIKLMARPYMLEEKKERKGLKDKTKTVTYINALSKTLTRDENQKENFKKLLEYTFLWYCFEQHMEFQKDEDQS